MQLNHMPEHGFECLGTLDAKGLQYALFMFFGMTDQIGHQGLASWRNAHHGQASVAFMRKAFDKAFGLHTIK